MGRSSLTPASSSAAMALHLLLACFFCAGACAQFVSPGDNVFMSVEHRVQQMQGIPAQYPGLATPDSGPLINRYSYNPAMMVAHGHGGWGPGYTMDSHSTPYHNPSYGAQQAGLASAGLYGATPWLHPSAMPGAGSGSGASGSGGSGSAKAAPPGH